MNRIEREVLAKAYIEHYSRPHEWDAVLVLIKRNNSATEWAVQESMNLAFDPDALWEFVLEVLRRDPPVEVLEVLAAGPLEDHLAKCGEQVIDRVEEQAKNDPKFRSLLGGVWRNNMSEEVWARVQAAWDRSEWDDGV